MLRAISYLRPSYLAGLTAGLTAAINFPVPTEASSPAHFLKEEGYYVRDGFIDTDKIASILSTLSSPPSGERARGKEVSKGRLHYNMLRTTFVESKEMKELIAEHVLPIAVSELGLTAGQMMMTEVQVVDSLPGSDLQIWHADNAYKGITVVIPLVDLTCQNGPTEIISGSHSLWNNMTGWVLGKERGGLSIVKPILSAGDGLVMDARLLHRGGANLSGSSRPILVIRFDSKKSLPPGMTVIGATVRYYLARTICFFLEFR